MNPIQSLDQAADNLHSAIKLFDEAVGGLDEVPPRVIGVGPQLTQLHHAISDTVEELDKKHPEWPRNDFMLPPGQ